jgi:hypothetical protein
MAKTYRAYNFASPVAATPVLVTTGTAIKTMLQIATPATAEARIVEWGVMVDGATTCRVELVETGAVAATVTAHVAAGIVSLNDPLALASQMTLGTAATGYTASAEGTVTATRLLDFTVIANAGKEWHQYPLGREPTVGVSKFLRVRVTSLAAVNMACYIEWEES